jgi:site-specific recombinase XerD
MKNSNLYLENLIKGFILCCKTEGKSPKTIEWYESFLNRFLRFLKTNNYSCYIEDIEKNHIRAFIVFLQTEARTPRTNKPLSGATVQGYVRSLKALFSWIMREEYLEFNPMTKIPIPKCTQKIINTFSVDQIAGLVRICRDSNGSNSRNMAMILLMLDCGIRVSELINIKLPDVDLDQGEIKIKVAKGNKERIIPIGSMVQKILWKYIEQTRPKPLTANITNLFLSRAGLPLTRNSIQLIMKRYGKSINIKDVRCSPHTLRHTFAKNYLLNGGDIFSLQKILGHSSLASVRNYLNLFSIDVKTQHQRFSPVDTMAGNPGVYPLVYSGSVKHRKRY